MKRRLEDVSHFFLDHRGSPQPHQVPFLAPPSAERRARVIYVAGLGDHVTAAMTAAGLAASAAHLGRRVLVGQIHEQPFGVAVALGVTRTGDESVVVEAASNLWVSPEPLLGTQRPGVLFDQRATAEWGTWAAQVDLVLVHVNNPDRISRVPGMPIPDEFLAVAGEGGRDAAIHLYWTIKRTLSWNPSMEVGLIALGHHDDHLRSILEKLVQAVGTFLGRECPVVGMVPDAAALSRAFLSGVVVREGRDEISRLLKLVAGRWAASDTTPGRRSIHSGARLGSVRTSGDPRGKEPLRGGAEPCP
jgi:hypothetical protein